MTAPPAPSPRASIEPKVRVAFLPWMVAGVRTQYENLRLVEPPSEFAIDTVPIVPYQEGGWIERLPVLTSSIKGTLRSISHAVPLLIRSHYDAVLTQALLPLLPLIVRSDARLTTLPAIVYTIDTTPRLMDGFHEIYYGVPSAGPMKRSFRDSLHRYVLEHCAAVVPWSAWAAQSFKADYQVPEERIHVIPPGIDLGQWKVPTSRTNSKNCDGSRPFRLLFVGADFERKGGPLLVDVFRSNLTQSCELHLVTKAEIEEAPGVHVYREFGPNEPGLRELYERCDALVLPTRADCFSLASIEAMACGLPVISCPVGGISDIVREGDTGFLIPANDASALLAAILSLLTDRSRAVSMGLAGRRVVEERFDNNRNGKKVFALLQELSAR